MPLQRTLQACRFGSDLDPRGIPVAAPSSTLDGKVEAVAGAKSGGSW